MSSIQEILASILQAVYGKDVRQAIHDGVEMAYNKADNAETSAAAAAEAASGSQNSAAASAQAAANSASSASNSANQAEQYKNEAFHTTPAGYEAFVGEVNSSLDYLAETGVKNIYDTSQATYPIQSGGLTISRNDDGSLDISAGTTNALFSTPVIDLRPVMKPGEKYTISFGIELSSNVLIMCTYKPTSSSNWVNWRQSNSGNKMVITMPDCYAFLVRLQILSGYTLPATTIYPMIQHGEQTDLTYQPYAQSNAALTNNNNPLNRYFYKSQKLVPNASTTITFPKAGAYLIAASNGQNGGKGLYVAYSAGNINDIVYTIKDATMLTLSIASGVLTIANNQGTFDIQTTVIDLLHY